MDALGNEETPGKGEFPFRASGVSSRSNDSSGNLADSAALADDVFGDGIPVLGLDRHQDPPGLHFTFVVSGVIGGDAPPDQCACDPNRRCSGGSTSGQCGEHPARDNRADGRNEVGGDTETPKQTDTYSASDPGRGTGARVAFGIYP
jgi:hypothetical protein